MTKRTDYIKKYREGIGSKFVKPPLSTFYQITTRCNNKNNHAYKNYGGRGIRCLWKNGKDFMKDMASSWKEGLSIDRIDNNGDYCKENCRWVEIKEQANNKRTNHFLEFNGEVKTIANWAREVGINHYTLYTRLNSQHWSTEDALTKKTGTVINKRDFSSKKRCRGRFIKNLLTK